MRRTFVVFGMAAWLVLIAGCELFGGAGEDTVVVDYGRIETIRFSRHVQPLLAQKCTRCHAGVDAAAGLRLDTWDHLIAGSDFGEAFIPFDPAGSLLLRLATQLEPAHPAALGADTLAKDEIDFLARWIAEGARNDAGAVPYAGSAQRLYVANQDAATISVIDMVAQVVMRTVRLADAGFPGTPKPHHVGVAPDGASWYVSLIGANTVARFGQDNRLMGQTPFFATPGMVAVHPDGDRVYAGRSLSAVDPPRSIGAIAAAGLGVEEVGVLFEKPHALRVSPDGAYVYIASLVTNQIAALQTATQEVSLTTVGGPLQAYLHLAIAPDSRTLYLTGQVAGQIQFFDLADPAHPVLVDSLAVAAGPWHPVLTPDGRRLYVGNKAADAVTVIDTERREVLAVLTGPGLAQPHGSAVSPDGRYVFISNNNARGTYAPRYRLGDNPRPGTVVVIDTATNTIVKVLEVGALAAGMDAQR